MTLKDKFLRLLQDQRGASAVELGLICALVVMAMVGALGSFANENDRTWSHVANQMRNSNNPGGA